MENNVLYIPDGYEQVAERIADIRLALMGLHKKRRSILESNIKTGSTKTFNV